MPKSHYLDNVILDLVLRGQEYTPPSGVYVALFTTAPTAAGDDGVEVSGGGYARQEVTFGAPSNQTVASDEEVVFPLATTDWGTIVAYALFDQAAAGNMLYFANLSASRAINTNDQVRFPAGQIICSEA